MENTVNTVNEKAVYKMNCDCGRQGNLMGTFVASKKYIEKLIEDKIEVYFGEVLGKHSEIYGSIDADEITLVTDNPDTVKSFEDLDLSSGYNPLDYTAINVEEDEVDLSVFEIIEKRLLS